MAVETVVQTVITPAVAQLFVAKGRKRPFSDCYDSDEHTPPSGGAYPYGARTKRPLPGHEDAPLEHDDVPTSQAVEVQCGGAIAGDERSVLLPDGRECLVRVPTDVIGDQFFIKWTSILPPARKRCRATDPSASRKDATWKHVDALIAALPSPVLGTSELLRLRAPPRTRVVAPMVEYQPSCGAPDAFLSEWVPVHSSNLAAETKEDVYEPDFTIDFADIAPMFSTDWVSSEDWE